MRREVFGALLMGVTFIGLAAFGVVIDLDTIPPEFGPRCRNDNWAQAEAIFIAGQPTPPPGVESTSEDFVISQDLEKFNLDTSEEFQLLELDQLSPRLGFGLNNTWDEETLARRLGAGWFIDWNVRERYAARIPEHWQMVRLNRGCTFPSDEAIHWLARHYPGSVWIIGNEPDNIWQDNVYPEEYAQVYRRLYYLIKDADSNAQVAAGGITQATPLRLAYLDRVLDAYEALFDEPMPVDWWTVHGFVLREERGSWGADIPTGFPSISQGELYSIADMGDVRKFQDHIVAFREWMAENGYRDKPLAITEFSVSFFSEYGYTPEVVARYLWETFVWLDEAKDDSIGFPGDSDRLVQRWAWYSIYSQEYTASNLVNIPADELTEIGWAFRYFSESHIP